MKKVLNNVLGYGVALLCIMWGLGVLIMINDFVEWTCADNLRFTIVAIIGIIAVIRMVVKEII